MYVFIIIIITIIYYYYFYYYYMYPGLPLISHVVEDDFEHLILLCLAPECWDYMCLSLVLLHVVLGV